MEERFRTGMLDAAPLEEIFNRGVFIRGRNNHALKGIRMFAVRSRPHMPFNDICGFVTQIVCQRTRNYYGVDRMLPIAFTIARKFLITAENPKIVTERSFYNIGNIRLDMESVQQVAHGKTRFCDTERMLANRGPVMMRLLKCLFHFAGVKYFPSIALQILHDPVISCGASVMRDP